MKYRIIVSVLLALVLVVIAVAFNQPSDQAPANPQSSSDSATGSYSGLGKN